MLLSCHGHIFFAYAARMNKYCQRWIELRVNTSYRVASVVIITTESGTLYHDPPDKCLKPKIEET